MRFLRIAALVLAASPAAAGQAQFPPAYRGIWATVGEGTEAGAGAPACKASTFDEHIDPSLVSVQASSVKYWEDSCDLTSLKSTDVGTVTLSLSCGGEGTVSKSKEIWTIQKVKGEDVAVMAVPSRSKIDVLLRCH